MLFAILLGGWLVFDGVLAFKYEDYDYESYSYYDYKKDDVDYIPYPGSELMRVRRYTEPVSSHSRVGLDQIREALKQITRGRRFDDSDTSTTLEMMGPTLWPDIDYDTVTLAQKYSIPTRISTDDSATTQNNLRLTRTTTDNSAVTHTDFSTTITSTDDSAMTQNILRLTRTTTDDSALTNNDLELTRTTTDNYAMTQTDFSSTITSTYDSAITLKYLKLRTTTDNYAMIQNGLSLTPKTTDEYYLASRITDEMEMVDTTPNWATNTYHGIETLEYNHTKPNRSTEKRRTSDKQKKKIAYEFSGRKYGGYALNRPTTKGIPSAQNDHKNLMAKIFRQRHDYYDDDTTMLAETTSDEAANTRNRTAAPVQCVTTTTTEATTTTTTKRTTRQFDIEKFLNIITNLTYDYYTNLTDQVNQTLIKLGVPTCSTPTTTEAPTTTTEAKPPDYSGMAEFLIGKCFVCGLEDTGIPYNANCADAFSGDFIPLVPQNPTAKGQIARFRKYCRYQDVNNYKLNNTMPRSLFGRWTGGCSVRWTDLSGVYTQRTCRNRNNPTTGRHFACKRMAKLELTLSHLENGCIISPAATLLPLSRGISLYARFHACVCTGNWCNKSSQLDSDVWVTAVIAVSAVMSWNVGLR